MAPCAQSACAAGEAHLKGLCLMTILRERHGPCLTRTPIEALVHVYKFSASKAPRVENPVLGDRSQTVNAKLKTTAKLETRAALTESI